MAQNEWVGDARKKGFIQMNASTPHLRLVYWKSLHASTPFLPQDLILQ